MKAHNEGSLQIETRTTPLILFTPKALITMELIVENAKEEIGWFATARTLSQTHYVIEEVFMFEQQVSGAECDIDKEDLGNLAEKMLGEPGGIEKVNMLRVWGHSHVNMSTGPSVTDQNTFKDFYTACNDFFIMLIINKSGSIRADLSVTSLGVIYRNCPWNIYINGYDDIKKLVIKEIVEKTRPLHQQQGQLWQQNWRGTAAARANGSHIILCEKFGNKEMQRFYHETLMALDITNELHQYVINWPNTAPKITIDNVLKIDTLVDNDLKALDFHTRRSYEQAGMYRVDYALAADLFKKAFNLNTAKDEIEEFPKEWAV